MSNKRVRDEFYVMKVFWVEDRGNAELNKRRAAQPPTPPQD